MVGPSLGAKWWSRHGFSIFVAGETVQGVFLGPKKRKTLRGPTNSDTFFILSQPSAHGPPINELYQKSIISLSSKAHKCFVLRVQFGLLFMPHTSLLWSILLCVRRNCSFPINSMRLSVRSVRFECYNAINFNRKFSCFHFVFHVLISFLFSPLAVVCAVFFFDSRFPSSWCCCCISLLFVLLSHMSRRVLSSNASNFCRGIRLRYRTQHEIMLFGWCSYNAIML